jgi:hypothetical protein
MPHQQTEYGETNFALRSTIDSAEPAQRTDAGGANMTDKNEQLPRVAAIPGPLFVRVGGAAAKVGWILLAIALLPVTLTAKAVKSLGHRRRPEAQRLQPE